MSVSVRLCALVALAATPALARHTSAVDPSWGKLPLAFEENRGQTDPSVRFFARRGGAAVFLTPTEAVFALRREPARPAARVSAGRAPAASVVRMRFAGGNPAELTASEPLPGRSNYLRLDRQGTDVVDVPQFARVAYRGVYPGIDLVFYGREGALEYDFELSPGADPSAIALEFDGTEGLRETPEGDILLCLPGGEVRMAAPVVFEKTACGSRPVRGRFALRGASRVAFEISGWDRSTPLVIDPTLTWSSYLGGNGDDAAKGIALDGSGNVYVCGETLSTNFPTTAGSVQPVDGAGDDAFVSKINAAGTAFVYSTYIGGAGTQRGNSVAVDAQGRAYVTGFSDGTDVDGDAFVVRLNAAGNSAAPASGGYSIQFGGLWSEEAFDIAVDASFNAWVTGMTMSANANNFPRIGNPVQPNFGGGYADAFATKLDANGTIAYSTYLNVPGDSDEYGSAIALDASGNVYVVGYYFPYCLSGCGTGDGFALRLNAAGTAFSYFVYLRGSADDTANDVAVDGSGNAHVTGTTSSTDFPTAGTPLQATNGGSEDAFFTVIGPTGVATYSTYLGTAAIQRGTGIALDPSGNVYLCGVNAAVDPDGDAFVVRLLKSGSAYLLSGGYSVTFGGTSFDQAEKIAADSAGNAYVAGTTNSTDFPTTAGSRQTTKGDADIGIGDAWVAKIGPSLPSLAIGNATVTEGNTGTVNAVLTVTLSQPSFTTVTVNWATADGTAVQPADYTAASGTLTFNPRETSKTVTVAVKGDTLDEANEAFSVLLSSPSANATIADGTGSGTITDDDASPTLTINDVPITEGNTGTANATFTVTLSAASGQNVTVGYGTADGTARQPGDYTATSGTLTFTPGQVSKTIPVPVVGDLLDEANETFSLMLSSPSGATILDGTGIGTITDDDATPTLSVSDATVTEGNTGSVNATFTVSLSAASGQTVTVGYATANGTAIAPGDYTAGTGTLTFTAGQSSRTVTVAVLGDVLDEANETFSLVLSSPVSATIADGTGVGTISDDDAAPVLSVGDATVAEGNTGTVNATFVVALSAASGQTVTVNYATANGTAAAGSDYTAVSGTATFTPGQTSKNVTVAVAGDLLDEPNETFSLVLSVPVNATIADGTGVGTITDDDAAPTISAGDATVTEGNTGSVNATFTVSLSAASGQTVTVAYATANGTATQPADYTAASGTVTFSPGQTSKTVAVAVKGDTGDEPNETFSLVLSSPVNATIADGTGVCTIADDDPTTAAKFYTLAPCRVLDTRNPNGPLGGPALAAGATRNFVLPGTCGIPSDAKAVSANVTAADAVTAGYMTIYPADVPRPLTNSISYKMGVPRANNTILKLPADATGTISVRNAGGTVNFILDVNGYYR